MNAKGLMSKRRKHGLGISDHAYDVIVTVLASAFMVVVLYPLIFVVSASFSSGRALLAGEVILWPVEFSLKGYQLVFTNQSVITGFFNSVLYVVCGVAQNMFLTVSLAYVLSRKDFRLRNVVMLFLMIPTWFGGGIVPEFILYSKLGMVNNRLGYILMAGISISNLVFVRTYFQTSVPGELLESAKVDGISDIGYLARILLPLSKPVLAVVSLYYGVATWNDYMGPLIYLRSPDIKALQLVLREILNSTQVDYSSFTDASLMAEMASSAEVMKYSLIIVSTVPLLLIYPLVKKFFATGVMMGSLKG